MIYNLFFGCDRKDIENVFGLEAFWSCKDAIFDDGSINFFAENLMS